jgi:hypothetical protein
MIHVPEAGGLVELPLEHDARRRLPLTDLLVHIGEHPAACLVQ